MSEPCYASIYGVPQSSEGERPALCRDALVSLAREFSPRFSCPRDDLVSIDLMGLDRLFGLPRTIGEELGRLAAFRGLRVQIAVAPTCTAAMVLALVRPGLTVVERHGKAAALATVPIGVLTQLAPQPSLLSTFQAWGIRTLGELAALPSAELSARLGRPGLVWQSLSRGEDSGPLVPLRPDERFESAIELEWPIEGLEPLSFVLTRLLEPLSARLERRDRGAAALHITLDLIAPSSSEREDRRFSRSMLLPSPIRDVRTLRTLILLDLESHPPPSGIERVSVCIDPTPGRIWQHSLFSRARPTPEQVSTLVARLNALMGPDRIGRPVLVDSYRPGAFETRPFAHESESLRSSQAPAALVNAEARVGAGPRDRRVRDREVLPAHGNVEPGPERMQRRARLKWESGSPEWKGLPREGKAANDSRPRVLSALRRCRQPVPARVAMVAGRPASVTADRRGFAGGRVLGAAGPWRTSGNWWSGWWDRDEWDVSLSDGAMYRIFQDHSTKSWFIDAIVD
jgi:protein ImuB